MTSDELSQLPRLQIPVSAAARTRIRAAAKDAGYQSYSAYIRSLIAAAIPELKQEFSELEEWGGYRGEEKTE